MLFNFAPILLGLLGSLHCIGMCGPIALSLPIHQLSRFKQGLAILLYNLGRSLSYVFLGLIFGSLGHLFFISGLQRVLSISAGIFILIWFISKYTSYFKIKLFTPDTFIKHLQFKLREVITQKRLHYLFLTGILNGFLPCGLVYVAIAAATTLGNTLDASLFMFLFGISTWPVMIALPLVRNMLGFKFKRAINTSLPYIFCSMGVLLILRGSNLGIPYISPKYSSASNKIENCGHTDHSHKLIFCKPN